MTLGGRQNIYFNLLWENVLEKMIAQELKYEIDLHEVDPLYNLFKGMLSLVPGAR